MGFSKLFVGLNPDPVFNEMSLQLSEWEQAWSPHSEGSHKDRPFFLFLKRNFKISVRYLEWSFPLWIWLMVSNCIYKGPTVASSCWPLRFSRTDKGLLICAKQRNSRLKTVAAVLLQRYNLSGWLTGGRTSVPSCQSCCREESLCLRRNATMLESVFTKTTNREGFNMIVSTSVYFYASSWNKFVLIMLCFFQLDIGTPCSSLVQVRLSQENPTPRDKR